MFMRRRPLLRAAAVGGTAYVAGRRVANRQATEAQAEDEQNERLENLEQQQPGQPAAAPAAGPAAGPSLLDQLTQLDALHQQGALTDNEFTAAKAKLLGS
jgi:Short C-terminal domain